MSDWLKDECNKWHNQGQTDASNGDDHALAGPWKRVFESDATYTARNDSWNKGRENHYNNKKSSWW